MGLRLWIDIEPELRPGLVDVRVLNESIFYSALFRSIPQIIIQSMNNSAVEWSIIGYISVVGSSLNILYGLYRLFYFNIHLGYQIFDAPFDLGPSENIGVSRSVDMKSQD